MGKHTDCYIQFGRNLRAYRKSIGYFQIDIAVATNLNRTYVSRIENGKARVTFDVIVKLVRGLHISSDILMRMDNSN